MLFMVGVLLTTLMAFYSATQSNLSHVIESSLDRVLNAETPERPFIGDPHAPSTDEQIFGQRAVAWIDYDRETQSYTLDDSAAIVGEDASRAVIDAVRNSSADEGTIPAFDVVWKKGPTDDGFRIAIANDAVTNEAMTRILAMGVAIGLVALMGVFFVVWRLSSLMLEPVRDSMQNQQRFTSDASHELKTPLAVMKADLRILKDSEDEMPPELGRWVDSATNEADRMQSLINDLLELSRADEVSQGASLATEDVDLSTLVRAACLEFEVIAFEHTVELLSVVEEDIHLNGLGAMVDRVVRILIDNAIKYAAPATRVTVRLSYERSQAHLSVTNLGEVLSAEEVAHIFDRFFRSDSARSRSTGGFGLGLAIAKASVEALGGTISCSSSEAQGTVFSVEVPARIIEHG